LKVCEVEFAAIDFESAGSEPGRTDEPVQVSIVLMKNGEIGEAFTSYLKPGRPVTWAARAVHGIGDDALVDAPRLIDLWPDVKRMLDTRWVVAHGAATEKRFLRVFPIHRFGPWIDTLTLTRSVFPSLPSHALADAVSSLGLADSWELKQPGFRWHDAYCDATASLVLLRHLIASAGIDHEPAEVLKSDPARRR
jgi:DNA polymerase-3 subunit epsilon